MMIPRKVQYDWLAELSGRKVCKVTGGFCDSQYSVIAHYNEPYDPTTLRDSCCSRRVETGDAARRETTGERAKPRDVRRCARLFLG